MVMQGGENFIGCPSQQLAQPQFANPITVGTTPVKLLDANPKRKEFIITNSGTTIIVLKFTAPPNYNTGDFHIILPASSVARDGTGGSFISDLWQGSVWAVGNNVSGEVILVEEI